MSYYDDYEKYYEPSLADDIFEEAKERLILALNQSIKTELDTARILSEKLTKENMELKEKVRDIEKRERELEREKANLLSNVRNEKLSEIMKDLQVVMFRVNSKTMYLPKCDKCNENRDIIFKSPSGKTFKEGCSCDFAFKVYVPSEHLLKEFNLKDGKINAFYELKRSEDDEYFRSSDYRKAIYKNQPYEQIKESSTYFNSLEECQAYCDWLNRDIDVSKLVEDRVASGKIRMPKKC